MADSLERLHAAVIAARDGDPSSSRTARLMQAGRGKMAKKLAEEAVEVVIDAMQGDTDAVVRESADLLYNLVVLWVAAGVCPDDVWAEMARREQMLGIAEKLPKTGRSIAPPISPAEPMGGSERSAGRREAPVSRASALALAGATRPGARSVGSGRPRKRH